MSADDDDPLAPLADAYAEFLFGLWQLEQQVHASSSASEPADAPEATTSGIER